MCVSARLRHLIPAPMRRPGRRLLGLADPLLLGRLRRSGELEGAIPPRELRARVGAPDPRIYVAGGAHVAAELESLLASAGHPLDSFSSILDLGSGPGRVLTRLQAAEGAELHCCDVDAEAIAWVAAAYPGIDARANAFDPPTPFESGSFDLVLALSVFTHLGPESERAWLAEVARLLAPGGVAVLTTHGPRLLAIHAAGDRPDVAPAQRRLLAGAELEREGLVFAPAPRGRWQRWRFPGVGDAPYGLSFHSRDQLRERWSEYLEVEAIAADSINWAQDAVICRRREA